jgi:hypothetical protein
MGVEMEGIVFNRCAGAGEEGGSEAITALLAKKGDLEIMSQKIGGESVVWLSPATDPSAIEFFFVHEGGVELALDDGARGAWPGRIVYGVRLIEGHPRKAAGRYEDPVRNKLSDVRIRAAV